MRPQASINNSSVGNPRPSGDAALKNQPCCFAGQRCRPSSNPYIAFNALKSMSLQQPHHAAPAVLHWRQCCLPAAAVNSPIKLDQADADAQQASQQPGSSCLQDLMVWLVSNGKGQLSMHAHIMQQGCRRGGIVPCLTVCLNWWTTKRGI